MAHENKTKPVSVQPRADVHDDPRRDRVAGARAFGRRLAQARREAGLTQATLAQRIGVTVRAVQYWEAGYAMPKLKLGHMAAVVRRSPAWLRTGTDEDETLRAFAATRQRTVELLEALHETLARSTAVLARSRERDARPNGAMTSVAARRFGRTYRAHADHLDQIATGLDADGEPDDAALERELATLLHAVADHFERRAADTHPPGAR